MEASSTQAPSLPLQALAKQLFGDALTIKTSRAAEVLDCGRDQVYRLLDSGKLQGINLSGSRHARKRVSVVSLLEFIQGGGVENDHGPSAAAALAAARAKRGPSSAVL
jgi:hypothetical protein